MLFHAVSVSSFLGRWKKSVWLASGVASHSGAHRQYLMWALSGLSQNNHSLVFRIDPITCVPNIVNDMACCITSFKPLIDLG